MERLWAPWRIARLSNPSREKACIFCNARDAREAEREHLVVSKSDHSLIMINRYPYTSGHLMVVAARHTAELDDLSEAELLDLMQGVVRARALLREVSRPDGFNIGANLGKAAGAGVEDHLHFHVVARWNGDTNFMTVDADVRVISEGLYAQYDRLSAAIGKGR
jgi:ATP adenylyltransferase